MTIFTHNTTTPSVPVMITRTTVNKRFVLQPRWALRNSGCYQKSSNHPATPILWKDVVLYDHSYASDSDGSTECASSKQNYSYSIADDTFSGGSRRLLPMRARNLDLKTARAMGFTKPAESTTPRSKRPVFPFMLDESDTPHKETCHADNFLQTPQHTGKSNVCTSPPPFKSLSNQSSSMSSGQACPVVRPMPKLFLPTDF